MMHYLTGGLLGTKPLPTNNDDNNDIVTNDIDDLDDLSTWEMVENDISEDVSNNELTFAQYMELNKNKANNNNKDVQINNENSKEEVEKLMANIPMPYRLWAIKSYEKYGTVSGFANQIEKKPETL